MPERPVDTGWSADQGRAGHFQASMRRRYGTGGLYYGKARGSRAVLVEDYSMALVPSRATQHLRHGCRLQGTKAASVLNKVE